MKARSNQELAENIERNRDNTEGWDSGPSQATVRKGSTVVFSLRLSADELEVLRDRAATRQITVSEVIRDAVFANAISVSFSTGESVMGTGTLSAAGIGSGSMYGGVLSTTGLCSSGPYTPAQTCWNANITTMPATTPVTVLSKGWSADSSSAVSTGLTLTGESGVSANYYNPQSQISLEEYLASKESEPMN